MKHRTFSPSPAVRRRARPGTRRRGARPPAPASPSVSKGVKRTLLPATTVRTRVGLDHQGRHAQPAAAPPAPRPGRSIRHPPQVEGHVLERVSASRSPSVLGETPHVQRQGLLLGHLGQRHVRLRRPVRPQAQARRPAAVRARARQRHHVPDRPDAPRPRRRPAGRSRSRPSYFKTRRARPRRWPGVKVTDGGCRHRPQRATRPSPSPSRARSRSWPTLKGYIRAEATVNVTK